MLVINGNVYNLMLLIDKNIFFYKKILFSNNIFLNT